MASWKKADLMQLSGAPDARGRPFAYVTHNDAAAVPRVVYRGHDNHIHELRLEDDRWQYADLIEQAGGAPSADSQPFAYETPFDGHHTPRVIYRAGDGHIYEIRLDGGSWKGADLTDRAGAPGAEGNPCAYVTAMGGRGVARVVYRSGDGHVWEVRLEDGSWKKGDLVQLAGAPAAAGDPFGYVTQDGSNQTARVVYVDTNGHVQELHLEGDSWKKADLSERSGAPAAASAPFPYAAGNEPRLVYRSADGHIQELRLEGGGWKKGDLTALAGASAAQGRPCAYASSGGSHPLLRVVYRADGGQIVELRLEDGSWKKADLTQAAGAPGANGDPVGYVTPNGSSPTPRVLYRADDAHIQELRLA